MRVAVYNVYLHCCWLWFSDDKNLSASGCLTRAVTSLGLRVTGGKNGSFRWSFFYRWTREKCVFSFFFFLHSQPAPSAVGDDYYSREASNAQHGIHAGVKGCKGRHLLRSLGMHNRSRCHCAESIVRWVDCAMSRGSLRLGFRAGEGCSATRRRGRIFFPPLHIKMYSYLWFMT